jgi:hypothetical protein
MKLHFVNTAKDENLKKLLRDVGYLEEDLTTIQLLFDTAQSLHCPHSDLDNALKELTNSVNKQLTDRHTADSQLLCTDMSIQTQ